MVDVKPDPKPVKRTRPDRRQLRKTATTEEWAALRAEKLHGYRCRCCQHTWAESLHHLVPRSRGGDDVADNLVPLCGDGTRLCHGQVESHSQPHLQALATSLTDAEYAYVIGKLGENALERLFGGAVPVRETRP